MKPVIPVLLAFVSTLFRSRLALQLEIVALRHQLTVYQRTTKRPRINPGDRIFWSWLSRRWSGWRGALVFVQTRTVLAWHRGFRIAMTSIPTTCGWMPMIATALLYKSPGSGAGKKNRTRF